MLRLTDFIIDCPDTMQLAEFYAEVTGRPVTPASNPQWAGIHFGEVDDVEAEQRRVLALGATLEQDSIGPDGYGWRVYTDPVGHPFCLCRNKRAVWTDDGLTWSGGA